jgi:hypothetical protein
MLDLLGGLQALLGNLGGIFPSKQVGLNAEIADCGSMDANTLKTHLVEPIAE